MQMMDLVLTPTHGAPLDGWKAFAHPLIYWLTCWVLAPFIVLVAFFTPRRQLLHDLVLGTLMVRRSPMERALGPLLRNRPEPAHSAPQSAMRHTPLGRMTGDRQGPKGPIYRL